MGAIMNNRGEEIRTFLIQQIQNGSPSLVRDASQKFKISRQAVNRYLKQLAEEGIIISKGITKNRKYQLKNLASYSSVFKLSPGLQEDKIWRDEVLSLLDDVSSNVIDICHYGFTEILNNAIDHSEGSIVSVQLERTVANITICIIDDGVGIFNKIKRELNLDDERHAILELSKGKLTTDPTKHTGEGIFFTSRVFDRFSILSRNLFFGYSPDSGDWLLEDKDMWVGTLVEMVISTSSGRTLGKVFDKYISDKSDFGFSKTHIPVVLARYGDENMVSRSQAKRLLNRLERFKHIIFDFKGVNMIGQAFADEIFRVFQNEYPNTELIYVHTNSAVKRMILRVKSQNSDSSNG
jgi:anti-sigma regulatory factor (Ser/Thr protein kinase)